MGREFLKRLQEFMNVVFPVEKPKRGLATSTMTFICGDIIYHAVTGRVPWGTSAVFLIIGSCFADYFFFESKVIRPMRAVLISRFGKFSTVRIPRISFRSAWDLLGYLFSPKTRARSWTPSVEEFKADYATALKKYRTIWPRIYLRFCFGIRTVVLVLQTFKVGCIGLLWLLVPESAKQLLRYLFRLP
jgi:hypothetical protein